MFHARLQSDCVGRHMFNTTYVQIKVELCRCKIGEQGKGSTSPSLVLPLKLYHDLHRDAWVYPRLSVIERLLAQSFLTRTYC